MEAKRGLLLVSPTAIYVLLLLAAWLTGQGLKAEAAFNERTIAKPPAFPRKTFAGALVGVSVFAITFLGADLNILIAAIFGGIAVGGEVPRDLIARVAALVGEGDLVAFGIGGRQLDGPVLVDREDLVSDRQQLRRLVVLVGTADGQHSQPDEQRAPAVPGPIRRQH